MNPRKIILLAGAVAIPVMGIAYYQHVKSNYDVTFQDVKVTSLEGGNIKLIVRFLITNKTGMRVTVFGSSFIIYANGVPIGIAQQPAPLVVPNNMISTMEANVIVDKGRLGSLLFDFIWDKISGDGGNINAVIQGVVKLQVNAPVLSWFTVNIPIDESYSL